MANRYGHLEHEYAERFAEALAGDERFRAWVLQHTSYAGRAGTKILREEMLALRSSKSAPWWKNYFTTSCSCFGCAGGRETDVFAVLEDAEGARFALHVEVKQPTDRFHPAVHQGERYRMRAECWAASAPRTVPAHASAGTILLCPENKLDEFRVERDQFEATITFEGIAREFPDATIRLETASLESAYHSSFALGQRVFHGKFGDGVIAAIEGNKLEIDFEHAGRKKVLDSFVSVG